jgi:hypothetical protein
MALVVGDPAVVEAGLVGEEAVRNHHHVVHERVVTVVYHVDDIFDSFFPFALVHALVGVRSRNVGTFAEGRGGGMPVADRGILVLLRVGSVPAITPHGVDVMDYLNVVAGRNKQVLVTGETIVVVDIGRVKRGRYVRAHAVLDILDHSLGGLARPTDKLKPTKQ